MEKHFKTITESSFFRITVIKSRPKKNRQTRDIGSNKEGSYLISLFNIAPYAKQNCQKIGNFLKIQGGRFFRMAEKYTPGSYTKYLRFRLGQRLHLSGQRAKSETPKISYTYNMNSQRP